MNDPDKPEVQSVHRVLRQALLTDGRIVPVTHWFGSDGNDCEPHKAVSCVCGTDETGWFALDLSKFAPAKVH